MGNWKYNMQIYTALLVFNRSKIVFTTFLSIQIVEQFVLYFIPRLFILFCVFPTSTLHNFSKRHISSFISAKNNLANFDQKKRKKFKPENGTDGSKCLFSSSFKKKCRLEKIAAETLWFIAIFPKTQWILPNSDGTGTLNQDFGWLFLNFWSLVFKIPFNFEKG